MIKFGPAGVSPEMKNNGVKKSPDAPKMLYDMGLSAFEYQCGNGVRVSDAICEELKENAEKYNIALSLHAPYFISLSSVEKEKREKSVEYILSAAKACKKMGGNRIVVHTGSCAKISREEALLYAAETLKKAVKALDENGLSSVHICPETMGKINQLGTLTEVLTLCKNEESLIPCIDFGHLNARTLGGLKTKNDFEKLIDEVENTIGVEKAKNIHCHFSKIEYTDGGEKKHLTFEDTVFGPEFEPLAEVFFERNMSPTVICESSEVMDKDALLMKEIYEKVAKK